MTVTSSGKQLTDLITVVNLTQMYPTDGMVFECTDLSGLCQSHILLDIKIISVLWITFCLDLGSVNGSRTGLC